MKQSTIVITLFIGAIVWVTGCGSKGQLDGLVPGYGVILYDEEPLANATVTFHPVQQSGMSRAATAMTDANGNFRLRTLQPDDGVQPGEYTVTVMKVESPPPPLSDIS